MSARAGRPHRSRSGDFVVVKRIVLLAALPTILVACAQRESAPDGYAPRVALPLARGPDHVQGRLELLEDARIRPEMRAAIAEAYGGDPCAEQPPLVLHSLCSAPGKQALRPAVLRL